MGSIPTNLVCPLAVWPRGTDGGMRGCAVGGGCIPHADIFALAPLSPRPSLPLSPSLCLSLPPSLSLPLALSRFSLRLGPPSLSLIGESR